MPVRTTLTTRENDIPIFPKTDTEQVIDSETNETLKSILAKLRGVKVDDKLDANSTNAVQNKVITDIVTWK